MNNSQQVIPRVFPIRFAPPWGNIPGNCVPQRGRGKVNDLVFLRLIGAPRLFRAVSRGAVKNGSVRAPLTQRRCALGRVRSSE